MFDHNETLRKAFFGFYQTHKTISSFVRNQKGLEVSWKFKTKLEMVFGGARIPLGSYFADHPFKDTFVKYLVNSSKFCNGKFYVCSLMLDVGAIRAVSK